MEQIDLSKINLPKLEENEKIGFEAKKYINASYSPSDFEAFICEWVKFCKYKGKTISIYNVGGTGDHGIDIDVFCDAKDIIYQCKKYQSPLDVSQIKTIITKALWYYFIDHEGSYPSEINIVALNDFSVKGMKLFEDKDKLKEEILKYYIQALDNESIDHSDSMKLDKFYEYLKLFDYNLTFQSGIDTIIKDYCTSEIASFRFRDKKVNITRINVDEIVDSLPKIYEEQIKDVLDETQMDDDTKNDYLNIAAKEFYSACSLRETCYYFFGEYDEYEKVENDILAQINLVRFNFFDSKFTRMQEILAKAMNTQTSDSYLDYSLHIVNNNDRKGTCHWLVNNGKFKWN